MLALDGRLSNRPHVLNDGSWSDPVDGRRIVGIGSSTRSLTYQIYDNQRQFVYLTQGSHDYPHYRLLIAGGVALTAGLVLAAVGFWILGAALRVPTDEAVIDHREGASTD